MPTQFNDAVNLVLQNEGGIETDYKEDTGGVTKYGISHTFLKSLPLDSLRRYGILGDPQDLDTIKGLTVEQARNIYKGEFWDHALFYRINNAGVGNYLFDMCVNLGISPAVKCCQRAVWAVLGKWQLLPDDGILGEQTLALVNNCGYLLLNPLRAERGAHYRAIVQANPSRADELKGWLNRTYGR